ncbi:hypothetical protein [Streptococcus cuniculi]|nr:hypothetical protein [Streptococcus cuniculi]QBX23168.1 hypothetical protein Javan116_0039 [Streptococcus phage Javan116]
MRAIKRLLLMMMLLPTGYVAFLLSPFLELFHKEESDGNKY